jgi:hypothetical protein
MQNSYTVTYNGQIFEIPFKIHNISNTVTGTNAVATFTFPTEGLSIENAYVGPGQGSYSSILGKHTVAVLNPKQEKTVIFTVKITDITKLNMSIRQVITVDQSESILANNTRTVWFSKVGESPCDPDHFVTPSIAIEDGEYWETIDLSEFASVECACCDKHFNVVANSEDNIDVDHISSNGKAYFIRQDPTLISTFDINVTCDNCADTHEYSSVISATITVNPLYSGGSGLYKANLYQSGTGAPVATVLGPNSLGNVVWTRAAQGDYEGTLAGSFLYKSVLTLATLPANSGNNTVGFSRKDGTDDKVRLTLYDSDSNGFIDLDGGPLSVYIEAFDPTIHPSPTPTPSVTITPSYTASITTTPSVTPSITVSNTISPSITVSISVSPSITPTLSATPSITPTISITPTVSPTITTSSSVTPTITITASRTASITATPSITPTVTSTPSRSA